MVEACNDEAAKHGFDLPLGKRTAAFRSIHFGRDFARPTASARCMTAADPVLRQLRLLRGVPLSRERRRCRSPTTA
jgi:hypothetical protein